MAQESVDVVMNGHDENYYRVTPSDGHTMLLMEPNPDERTFSDYPDMDHCLDTLLELYEKCRLESGLDKENFTIDELCLWIENFHRLEVFAFDEEIARYKRISKSQMRDLFIEQIQRVAKADQNNCHQNGVTTNGVGASADDEEEWE